MDGLVFFKVVAEVSFSAAVGFLAVWVCSEISAVWAAESEALGCFGNGRSR